MPDESLKPALRAALRMHEIGTQSPYKLYFVGFMQGDLAAGKAIVRTTFHDAMAVANLPEPVIASLIRRLSVHLIASPLTPQERDQTDAALLTSRGLVDAMDESLLADVYDGLDTCVSTAFAANRTIAAEAQLLFAMWINMSGPPTKLLTWLSGDDPGLNVKIPAASQTIDANAAEGYLHATDYYTENPQNFPHLLEALAAGEKLLPQPASIGFAVRDLALETSLAASLALKVTDVLASAVVLPADGYVYEQSTGRMFARQDGKNDWLATGYSGSEQNGGKNDPSKQCERDIGPLPRGSYSIGDPFTGPSPFSLRLSPDPTNEMCGRDNFLIHGDSIAAPGTASDGCIILERTARERIYQNKLGKLYVLDRLG
jgi:hypothetical protein